jgi:ribonuclease HIII
LNFYAGNFILRSGAISDIEASSMNPKTSFTQVLTPAQQESLIELLKAGNYHPITVPYTRYAAETPDCRIHVYLSGKCLVQGRGTEEFITFILEPQILLAPRLGYETILDPDSIKPHMGVDESGKGDFFGPLVTAGAFVDEKLYGPLKDLGVRDSKTITSDAKAIDMARSIERLLGPRKTVVMIGPARYNSFHIKVKSVNNILAWAHARCIENILMVVPDCPRAISDQFGQKQQVIRALMQKGKKIELVQRHKAESDLAVAAASVLARAGFLLALKKIGATYNRTIPKGASPAVIKAGCELVKAHGPQILNEVSKNHFRTTDVILEQCGLSRKDLVSKTSAVSEE